MIRHRKKAAITIWMLSLLLYLFTSLGYADTDTVESDSNFFEGNPDYYEGLTLTFERIAASLPPGTERLIDLTQAGQSGSVSIHAELFADLGLLVYGSPDILQGNTFRAVTDGYYRQSGVAGEYRYHGYSADGNLFTNQQFPNDMDGSKTLSAKKWLHLPWTQIPGVNPSGLNQAALSGDQNVLNWFDQALPFDLLSSSEPGAARRGPGYSKAEHLLILSAPSSGMPGEGRMWHVTDNHRWYQTFSLPPVYETRQKTPHSIKVEILDKGTHDFGLSETLSLRVRLTATLYDGAIIGSSVQKALWQTRLEIFSWTLSESTSTQSRNLMPAKTFTTFNGIDSDNNATLSSIVTLQIHPTDLDADGRFTFSAESGIEFRGGIFSDIATGSDSCEIGVATTSALTASFSVSDVLWPSYADRSVAEIHYSDQSRGAIRDYHWTFSEPVSGDMEEFELSAGAVCNELVAQRLFDFVCSVIPEGVLSQKIWVKQSVIGHDNKTETIEKPFNVVIGSTAKAVDLNVSLPEWSFDVVPYGAQDKTDHSETADFSVSIDGIQVDTAHFFSGNFKYSEIFGPLGYANRFAKVVVNAVSSEGIQSFEEHYIEIVSTQPKAVLSFEGSQKINRKITVINSSEAEEDPRLRLAYPAQYQFSYNAISGSDSNRRILEISDNEKQLLYKAPGLYQVSLTATNALGRISEPYNLDVVINDDRIPAVIFNVFSGVIARGETLEFTADVASTDGDILGVPSVRIYFDSGMDGIYEKLLGTYSLEALKSFQPVELGAYRMLLSVSESFGQPTLPAFITGADTRKITVVRNFLCDNLRPVQTLDIEVPRIPEKVDVLIMISSALAESDRERISDLKIEKANQLRLSGLEAEVHVWNLGESTNTVTASVTQIFGTANPPPTIDYAESGYSGTLSLVTTSDNGRYIDVGHYHDVETCQTEQIVIGRYCPEPDPFICYVSGGYVDVYEDQVICETERIWDSDIQWRSNYYGTYEGTLLKTLNQAFDPQWLRFGASRYVVYMGDSDERLPNIEATLLREKAGATWITAGGTLSLKDFMDAEHAVYGMPENALNDAIEWIGRRHKVSAENYVLLNDPVNYHLVEVETEGDLITGEVYQIVQESCFDTPLPPIRLNTIPESTETIVAASAFDAFAFYSMIPPPSFESVGHFEIFRKLWDFTGKEIFDLESNLDNAALIVHRKPVAALALQSRFSTEAGKYSVMWNDLSYDWDHIDSDPKKGIVRNDFRIRPIGGEWNYSFPEFLEGGAYEVSYVVWDLEGQLSEPVDYYFVIDNSAPEISFVSIKPDPAVTGGQPTVVLLPEDFDSDLLNLTLLVQHENSSHQFEQHVSNITPGIPIVLKMNEALNTGTYRLTAEVTDGNGGFDRATRSLTVRLPEISEVNVTGRWNHWRGQIDRQGRQIALNPLRFLSYEMIRLDVIAEGEPDSVSVRLSPELEAMAFLDANGNFYQYEEDFSKREEFPIQLMPVGNDHYCADYALPLAASTLDWRDIRLREAYWIEITANWGSRTEQRRISGIELTGNVYDLIF